MSTKDNTQKKSSSPFHHLLCCVRTGVSRHSTTMLQQPPADAHTSDPSDPGIEGVLSCLDQLGTRAGCNSLDLCFLKDLLHSADFQSLLKVHEKVTTPETPDLEPLAVDSLDMHKKVCGELRDCYTPDAQELLCLLLRPHIKALLHAHDIISLKQFHPDLPIVPYKVDEDEESAIKVIRLVKGPNEPLGATIHLNERSGMVKIARVMKGGAAHRSGLIHVGDQVQEVNGVQVNGMPPEHIIKLLSSAVGPVTLKLSPAESCEDDDCQESKMRVRAQFSYNPTNDQAIPCREAGLTFNKGDILHIVSMTDALWWQARREGDNRTRAALIPSGELQERRMTTLKSCSSHNNKDSKDLKNQKSKFSPRLNKRPKKNRKTIQSEEEPEEQNVMTYEELAMCYPKEGQYRPIVLIGPQGVGRATIKRRLLASNPDHFQTPIPHTSRPPQPGEADGNDFYFINRSDMEKDIENRKFLEYGEFKGHLYGTSLEQVKSVINQGRVCLLCPQPQAIKSLRTAEIKPYIVLVKPPTLEEFKMTRLSSTEDGLTNVEFTDEDISEMIQSADNMEAVYAHVIDDVIINGDLQTSVNEMGQLQHRLETEPHWVPALWVR